MTALDRRFRVSVIDPIPTAVPVDRFSVRKNSVIWWQGSYYMYADVIPWDHPFHPDSYDTSIHILQSDEAQTWVYHGEVIPKGPVGSWAGSGVATPGACVFDGKIYVAYSVRGRPDGSSHRFISVATSNDPFGPFEEVPNLRIVPEGYDYSQDHPTVLLDDPCLVASNADGTGPGNERLCIYYRHSLYDFREDKELVYNIASRCSTGAGSWKPERTLLTGKKLETCDARWSDGRLILTVLAYSEGEMAVYISQDGENFEPAEPHLLESYLNIFMPATCFRLPGFIQNPAGEITHITTPGDIDDQGHYTMFVFRVESLAI